MSATKCQAVLECPAMTMPGLGVQVETFSAPTFIAVATAPANPPPLGWHFDDPISTQPGQSNLSQEDALNQGIYAAIVQAQSTWEEPFEATWDEPIIPISDVVGEQPEYLEPVEPIF